MFRPAMERRESQVFNDGNMSNFEEFHAKLEAKRTDIYDSGKYGKDHGVKECLQCVYVIISDERDKEVCAYGQKMIVISC